MSAKQADAAPILRQASELTVLTVDPQPEMLRSRDIEPYDLLACCSTHGFLKPKEIDSIGKGINVGERILNAAADHSCHLIVMGLDNRSRVREWILGGTSKTLLQSMTVPILVSH